MEGNAMAEILTQIGTFFTQAVTWMTDILDVVVSNPVLLIMVICMPVAGFAIGLLGRLFNLR